MAVSTKKLGQVAVLRLEGSVQKSRIAGSNPARDKEKIVLRPLKIPSLIVSSPFLRLSWSLLLRSSGLRLLLYPSLLSVLSAQTVQAKGCSQRVGMQVVRVA
jgi:hypothetical protein